MNSQLRQSLLERQPLWLQALMFVPETRREASGWLWLLLDEMQQTALLPSQSSNARLKLAWWQEQIARPASGQHPATRALQALCPDLLQAPHWTDWFRACDALLTQPLDQALTACQQAWLALENILEDQGETHTALARLLGEETALAQQRNRIRFGLPGHAALADISPDFWPSLPEQDPQYAQADARIRQLAAEALAQARAVTTPTALASHLRGWIAHYRLGQWQKQGLGAYNGLHISPWRSLLGFWNSARRHRSQP